jgi:hypothetical protein
MTVGAHIQQAADLAANEMIVELYGSSFYQLPVALQAQYRAEIVLHIHDWLARELEVALGSISHEQMPPGEWRDQREFDAIVKNLEGSP